MAAASVSEQDGHLWARGGCFRLGPLGRGRLFRLPRAGVGGVMFGGRRAVILKPHGFDLLYEKGEQRHVGEMGDLDSSPHPPRQDLICAASLSMSLLALPRLGAHAANTCVCRERLPKVRCLESKRERNHPDK